MDLLKPKDVANQLGVSEQFLAQMRYLGTGPVYVKLNSKNVRYQQAAIDAWIGTRVVGQSGGDAA